MILMSCREPEGLVRMIINVLDEIESNIRFDSNLILWRSNRSRFNAALFPRSRHRPGCFYLPEPDRIIVSPGSVEMGGRIVVPRAQDWQRIGPEDIKQIYREVCLQDDKWRTILQEVERKYAG